MRFITLHKTVSYCMALAAVGSLVGTPEFSLVALALVLLSTIASWFVEPPRFPFERFSIVWNVVTVGYLALLIVRVLGDASIIEAGVHFLLFVLVNKLFNRQTSRDYLHIYVVSFLLLVAATTLNTSLSYAICFVSYVFLCTWALTLLHLRREMELNYVTQEQARPAMPPVDVQRILNSRRIINVSFLLGTSLMSLSILGFSALLFVSFPRVGFGFFANAQRRSSLTMVGFNDEVKLGLHGTIRDNPNVVMRVSFPQSKPEGRLLWRGSAFDRYEQGQWSHSEEYKGKTQSVFSDGEGYYLLNHVAGLPEGVNKEYVQTTLLRQDIALEPIESNVIFAADRPVALVVEPPKIGAKALFIPRRGPFSEIRGWRMSPAGVRYTAYSLTSSIEARLRDAEVTTDEETYAPFLDVPDTIEARFRTLAQSITDGKKTDYERVAAVEQYLKRNYQYTVSLTHAPGIDPVEEFLFVTKRGHCEYFASAMALLLRTLKIPARQVNGFAGGEWNDYGGYLAVRQRDAHAWTEVHFDEVGWSAFDPTPTAGIPVLERNTSIAGMVRQMVDALRARWFGYVVEYDLNKQIEFFKRMQKQFSSKRHRNAKAAEPAKETTPRLTRAHIAALVIMLAAIASAWIGWRQWQRSRREYRQLSQRSATHLVTKLYLTMLHALAKRGVVKPPHATPEEFVSLLTKRGFSEIELLKQVTSLYYQLRFSSEDSYSPHKFDDLVQMIREVRIRIRHADL